ncbi:30S ribosomal protein S5 [Candidatus Peregrinibacteria bacterium]|nr:30S ribosomal protein S5 [Candidatus Peregrinibacteria bacterium]
MAKKPHSKRRPEREAKEFEEGVLQIDRVTRVVKGGRRLRFRATVIIGDRKGRVGVGVGKSEEVVGAIQKAIADAKKNLITVKLDRTTIPHEVTMRYKSAHILLLPAAEGTGIIAGGAVRKVVELSGIKDILSKSFGTTNKISCSRGTLKALENLRETPFSKKQKQAAKPEQNKKPEQHKRPEPNKKPEPNKNTETEKKPEANPEAKKPEPQETKPTK